MGYAPRAMLAGGLGLAASLLVACGGSSGLLSGGQADNLNSQLDQVSQAVDTGQCATAANAASAFSQAVTNLPGSVKSALVSNLQQGALTVSQLAAKDCTSRSTTTATTSSTSTTTSTSTSTSTSPTSTTSTSTTSTPTSTTATSTTGTGTSTTTGSGGAGLGGTGTGTVGGTGGAGPGNGGGNGQ